MSGNIKIIFGVPYSAREFEGVLDEYGVKDLDTGASYVGPKVQEFKKPSDQI